MDKTNSPIVIAPVEIGYCPATELGIEEYFVKVGSNVVGSLGNNLCHYFLSHEGLVRGRRQQSYCACVDDLDAEETV